MNEVVIAAKGLCKRYGKAIAVDGIDLTIRRGEVFGLLGPNGAGKTTTILMLLGLTESSGGHIEVCGFDPMRDPLEVKSKVGYLPDSVGFYENLTARENLRYTGRLAGIGRHEIEPRIDAALHGVRLDAVADTKVRTFSRGMQQRLGLADVLMKRAEVAILDEPTSGLDPQSTFEFLDMIRGLKADGIAVLLSSHILDRVQAVCDRVAFFDHGRIALQGTVAELAHQVLGGSYALHVESSAEDGLGSLFESVAGVQRVLHQGAGRYHILADRDVRAVVAQALIASGRPLLRLESVEADLDVIYRKYFESRHGTA